MPKNIVLCSDGTGNTTIKGRGTNVFKLFEAVELNDPKTPQISFYDDGVGTERVKLLRMFGGAFGWGLSENIKKLYKQLAWSYEPGDRIFMFGFSRGAFTVRSLAGFVNTCGILNKKACPNYAEFEQAVEVAYQFYRLNYKETTFDKIGNRFKDPAKTITSFNKLHDERKVYKDVEIDFIGVWDTVDAVGLPFDVPATLINDHIYRYKFHDYKLSNNVKKARHALSIDDERQTFHPLLWDEDKGQEKVEQVWFPGVHSNVGGGYPKQGMSLVSLNWMMNEAEGAGLKFVQNDMDSIRDHMNYDDKMYDSRAGFAVFYRYKPRDIKEICMQYKLKPKVHISALRRVANGTEGYAPGNLPVDFSIISGGDNTEKAKNKISEKLIQMKADPSLLGLPEIEKSVSRRISSYWLFLAGTVATFLSCCLLFLNVRLKGLNPWFHFNQGNKPLESLPVLFVCHITLFAVIAALAYKWGKDEREKMEKLFSQFWHSLSDDISFLLKS